MALAGCVATNTNYRPDRQEISEPAIGATSTAYVGDDLLRQGIFVEQDAIRLRNDVSIGLLGGYKLGKGVFLKKGEDKVSGFYLPSPTTDGGSVTRTGLADPIQTVRAFNDGSKICVVSTFNEEMCTKKGQYSFIKKAVATEDAFQQTLIYSGKVGTKINIGYRESSGNIARPAFNNDVEYDLSESNVIGYKGASLEILEATNDHITYRVLKNFNAARN